MSLEPKNSIRLTDALQREVYHLAQRTGAAPLDVVGKALELFKSDLEAREASGSGNGAADMATNVYGRWEAARLIGAKGLPADLSTNPKHMDGFGDG